ncbi:MAG: translation elongation factor-like protein [bacterium]
MVNRGGEIMVNDKVKNDQIGKITHYYSKIGVGIIKLDKELKVGDTIQIKGSTSDFNQKIEELQLNHKSIDKGVKSQEIGVKLSEKVRDGDVVFIAK